MTQEQKDIYLSKAKKVLNNKTTTIKKEIDRIPQEVIKLKDLLYGSVSDKLTHQTMTAMYRKRYDDLLSLCPSPYFYFCLVKLDGEKDYRELFFSKFAFDQESIYSWASPISQIRFESPGRFSFESKAGWQSGEMIKKDQYLINDGKIFFLSTESQNQNRELVYQEYFSTRKTAFILPEIVAQMEKAQDQVVRAEYGGRLAVTGPAGSGKTTLALHRVAYLLQSPETTDELDSNQIIIFVQDENTRDYFSHLLPELGIKDVEITTLSLWAKKILPIEGWKIIDYEKDSDAQYTWLKIKALKSIDNFSWQKDWFNILLDAYSTYMNQEQKNKLLCQRKNKILDRIDLAILLKSITEAEEGFNVEREYYTIIKKTQEVKRKKSRIKTTYKLMIIDEFQNYLPEHLELFSKAINSSSGEIVYIGDFNQRVRLGTINKLDDIEKLPQERLVKLSKVYRNTKEILIYLKGLGYQVDIPEMIKSGPKVEELIMGNDQQIKYIENKLTNLSDVSVGILSHNENLLKVLEGKLKNKKNIKIMSLIDAQGVEFDTVFLIGVDDNLLSVENIPSELLKEVAKIKKDLLYIALTRAMNNLFVLGNKKLSLMV